MEATKEQIIKNWTPIIDANFSDIEVNKKEAMCIYAHHHTLIERTNNNLSDKEYSLLPLSLLLFSKLNIPENVTIKIIGNRIEKGDEIISATFKPNDLLTTSINTGLITKEIELSIIEEAANRINDEIKTNLKISDKFDLMIHLLIESFTVIAEKTLRPLVQIKMNYKIK